MSDRGSLQHWLQVVQGVWEGRATWRVGRCNAPGSRQRQRGLGHIMRRGGSGLVLARVVGLLVWCTVLLGSVGGGGRQGGMGARIRRQRGSHYGS